MATKKKSLGDSTSDLLFAVIKEQKVEIKKNNPGHYRILNLVAEDLASALFHLKQVYKE